jgi:TonB family protein
MFCLEKQMTSTNHASVNSPFPFLFNAQRAGILISVAVHFVVVLLLFLTPVIEMIPPLQTIPISLEIQESSSLDTYGGTKRITAARVNQTQNTISSHTFLKPAPVQKEVFRENTVSGRRETIKPLVAESRNLEVAGSINTANQGVAKAKASIASETESRGIAETQFGATGAPAFIHREMPVYPMLARRFGKEGKVILKLLIDRNGKLEEVEVVESAGFGFTEAAVAAVKNSTYAPGRRNGEKVTTRALLPVRFHLQ